jgi:hypothetical protein
MADMYVDETEQVKAMVAAKIAEASEKPVEKEKESDEPLCIPGANHAPSDFQQ